MCLHGQDGHDVVGDVLINAEAETILEKRTYKYAFATNRCLVVADSFFEWRREGNTRQPVRFMLKSEEPFAFAGIWNHNEIHNAFVIITTQPNDLVRPQPDARHCGSKRLYRVAQP